MRVIEFASLRGARTLAEGLHFPECPRFALGEIYFVDGPAVRAADLHGNSRKIADLPTPLCLGLQVEADGTIYVGGSRTRQVYRVSKGEVSVAADFSGVCRSPTNELVRLRNGAILVGEMGFDLSKGEAPQAGGFFVAAPDGRIRKTGPDVVFPNGMLLVDDGATLFVVGDMGRCILRLSLRPDGEVEESVAMPLRADPEASADGIARTTEGRFWYGDMAIGSAVRCDHAGVPDLAVKLGVQYATSCATFESDGEEWLAVTATDQGPFDDRATGRLLSFPLAAVE